MLQEEAKLDLDAAGRQEAEDELCRGYNITAGLEEPAMVDEEAQDSMLAMDEWAAGNRLTARVHTAQIMEKEIGASHQAEKEVEIQRTKGQQRQAKVHEDALAKAREEMIAHFEEIDEKKRRQDEEVQYKWKLEAYAGLFARMTQDKLSQQEDHNLWIGERYSVRFSEPRQPFPVVK